jgi:hypothetical protein
MLDEEARARLSRALGGGMVGDALANNALDALGLEQVGWWIEDKHRHTAPQPHGTICGEFRFTEEEDGCPLNGTPVYRLKGNDG